MKYEGRLEKMETSTGEKVQYFLTLGEKVLNLNLLLRKNIKLTFLNKISCINCGKTTKKSYAQGHCYPCSIKLAACDLCILKPETCHYHLGTCREPAWGETHCLKPHLVYLANSSGLKVGITRKTNVPFRWMDQGASQVLPILEVPSRLVSGKIEILFKKHISDKTDWRKMLKGKPEEIDLVAWKNKLFSQLTQDLKSYPYNLLEDKIYEFDYPVIQYPEKISSISLDKSPEISGQLTGIKGQYLIIGSAVLNVRAHSGYEITFEEDENYA